MKQEYKREWILSILDSEYCPQMFKDKLLESFYTALIDFKVPISCNHNWVTTQGFNSEYIDCNICGAKKED